MFDSSFELLPPAALRRFQHFQSMKITDRRMIEPAAAPITTPIISPRELAMEVFEAARVDAEVSIALLGDVGDVVEDANKDGDTDNSPDGCDEGASGSLAELVFVAREVELGVAEGVEEMLVVESADAMLVGKATAVGNARIALFVSVPVLVYVVVKCSVPQPRTYLLSRYCVVQKGRLESELGMFSWRSKIETT